MSNGMFLLLVAFGIGLFMLIAVGTAALLGWPLWAVIIILLLLGSSK